VAQGFENAELDTSRYASGLAGSAGTGGASGSGAHEQRTPASRNRPRVEQAAPGGSASSRNIPMSGGARPPRLAASACNMLYQRRALRAAESTCCACASAVSCEPG